MKKTLIVLVAILALVFTVAFAEEAHTHSLTTVKLNDADCLKAETYRETCSGCDYSNTFTVGSALGHNMETKEISKATCTKPAVYEEKCTRCGEGETFEVGSVLPHDYKKSTKTEATCTVKAVYEYKCSVCGDSYEEVGDYAKHNWKIEVESKNCEVDLYVESCSVCGELNQKWEKETGVKHNWEVITKDATCTAAKTFVEKCTKCSEINQEWTEGNALPHPFEVVVVKAATCTTPEMSQKKCPVCGATEAEYESAPALGHSAVVVPGYAATCTEKGLTDGSKCEVCGVILLEQVEIPALGHDYEKNRVVEPTETKRGYTEYKCTQCGDRYRARYTAALGVAADAALAPYGEGIVTDLDDVAMPYTAVIDEEIGRVIITATDKGVLRELHMSLALVEQWKAEGLVEVEFIVDEAEIVIPFAVLETEMMEEIKATFPATLTGYIVTLDPVAVNEEGVSGVLVKVDLTADTAEEDGIEMEVTDAIEGMKLAIGDEIATTVIGGGVYPA